LERLIERAAVQKKHAEIPRMANARRRQPAEIRIHVQWNYLRNTCMRGLACSGKEAINIDRSWTEDERQLATMMKYA